MNHSLIKKGSIKISNAMHDHSTLIVEDQFEKLQKPLE